MEVVSITPDWSVELHTPQCELKMNGCTTDAGLSIRVHGCALYFACESCTFNYTRNVWNGYREFHSVRCTICKAELRAVEYLTIVRLEGGEE